MQCPLLRFVVELARLLPLQTIMFLLHSVVNQVANNKRWSPVHYVAAEPPEHIRQTLGERSGESPLFEGGNVVLGLASNMGQFAKHLLAHHNRTSLHLAEC